MNFRKYSTLGIAAVFAFLLLAPAPQANAQISITFGHEPSCPYGYFDYAPYNCAPYGYYGPEWFSGGVFIGAGHWYHGPRGFHGHVDNHFDPRHGYHGAYPHANDHRGGHDAAPRDFHGNEARDGHGHAVKGHSNDHGHHDDH